MNRFTIRVVETSADEEVVRYEQTVDTIDLPAIINAVNSVMPAGNRKRALRSDAGKPRPPRGDVVTPTADGDVV